MMPEHATIYNCSIRRVYRKLAKRKGSGFLRCITVFVRHENVIRLLDFLGYRLE
jgi:hypothetical protein